MKNQFDELAKGLAQSVTRRAALKKFGLGLAGMLIVACGLGSKANANNTTQEEAKGRDGWPGMPCRRNGDCPRGYVCEYTSSTIGGWGRYCVPK